MASSINLEAICVTTRLPHGSMCGVIKCCGLVACKLNICVYAPLIVGAIISVGSAPALQAL